LRPNNSVDQDATWYGDMGLGPGDFVLDGDLPKKGAEPLPNFRPMSNATKRLHGSRSHLAWR